MTVLVSRGGTLELRAPRVLHRLRAGRSDFGIVAALAESVLFMSALRRVLARCLSLHIDCCRFRSRIARRRNSLGVSESAAWKRRVNAL